MEVGEACDDGNTTSNDGCSSTCTLEYQRCTWTFECAWSPYAAGEACTSDSDCTTACDDIDNDGVCDVVDNCVNTPNPEEANNDGDEFGNACDNCVDVANNDQIDTDNDGIGDACEGGCVDAGSDGICDVVDNCLNVANPDQNAQKNKF